MTFKERLQKEHPEKIDRTRYGGCWGCPYDYDYERRDDRPCASNEWCRKFISNNRRCSACWNREIPETEPAKPNSNVSLVDLIERAGTKKDISLLIHINGDDTTISVYPCPDPSEKKGNPVAEAYKLLVGSPHSAEAFENAIKKLEEALEC
jgi:hypothetical protein